jgi:hypothetical protein
VANMSQEPQPPQSLPSVNPSDVAGAGQTRLIVEAVKETVSELKSDVRAIREHRFTDMLWHIGALAATLVILGGMMVATYFKVENRLQELSTSATRTETKLDDLLQRIPPVSTPPPNAGPKK